MSDENVLGSLEQKVKLRKPQTAAKLRKRDKQTSKLSKNLIKLDSELRVYLLVEDWEIGSWVHEQLRVRKSLVLNLTLQIEFTGRPNVTSS